MPKRVATSTTRGRRTHLLDRATSQRPRAELRLLLRAALLDRGPAVEAWESCRELLDPLRLDAAAQRLAPQLYRNLRAAGVRDPRIDALRDVHLKTWSLNRIRYRQLATLVEQLGDAGIEVLVLKGAALVPLAYGDYGARPMSDFDVLVRRDHAPRAMRLLGERGWTPTLPDVPAIVDYRHANELAHPSGQRLDLHWNVLHECCAPGANDEFWRAAEAIEVDGWHTRTLCAADMLLHVLVHGARWSPVQPAGWIADAAMLLRAQGERIDWTRFVTQARRRRLVVPVRRALRCLRDCLDVAPPGIVGAELDAAPSSFGERVEYAVKTRPRLLVGSLPVLWFDYARLARGRGRAQASTDLSFGGFLRCTYRVPPTASLPVELARIGARRLRGVLSGDAAAPRAAPPTA